MLEKKSGVEEMKGASWSLLLNEKRLLPTEALTLQFLQDAHRAHVRYDG